jgi:predicted transcriptional regulator
MRPLLKKLDEFKQRAYNLGMGRNQAATHCLEGATQLAALSSPLRLEMIGELKASGPCSIRQLAERMDRAADGLYHHVRVLLRAGVLVQSGERKVGRRIEAVYALAADRIGGKVRRNSAASREAAIRAAGAVARLAMRELTAAVRAGDVGESLRPKARAMRQKTWLTDESLHELLRLLTKVEELLARSAVRKQGRPYSLTTILAPLQKTRGS